MNQFIKKYIYFINEETKKYLGKKITDMKKQLKYDIREHISRLFEMNENFYRIQARIER